MARETKAERKAEEARMREFNKARESAEYPAKLMALMQRAQAVNFEVLVNSDCTFTLRDRDDRDYDEYTLDLTYSTDAEELLHNLSWRVECKEEDERERKRQYQVRQAALAKLSQEEKELLGL